VREGYSVYKAVKQVCATCGNVNKQAYPGKMVCYKQNTAVKQAVLVKGNGKCNRWKGHE